MTSFMRYTDYIHFITYHINHGLLLLHTELNIPLTSSITAMKNHIVRSVIN